MDSPTTPSKRRAAAPPELERAVTKMSRRVNPIFLACAFAVQLVRSCLAYAALSFNRDNHFTAGEFSIGASLFFITFGLFQIPSNLVMLKVGVRAWLAFLLVGCGLVAACFALVNSASCFYLLQLLLGLVQSGTLPAMWHAISGMFPDEKTTKPFAWLTIGTMLANAGASPLAVGFLSLDGVGGLRRAGQGEGGWQWLYVLEAIPCVLLAAVVIALLPDGVPGAAFLEPEERRALAAEIARGGGGGDGCDEVPEDAAWTPALLFAVLRNRYMWLLCVCGALVAVGAHVYHTFTPILVANTLEGRAVSASASVAAASGKSTLLPVALSAVPFVAAVVLSYAVAASSQARGEVYFHVAGCYAVAGCVMGVFPALARVSPIAAFASLSLSLALSVAGNGPALTLIARVAGGRERPLAMPLFSSVAVVGGVLGPCLMGALMNREGGFTWPSVVIGSFELATGLLVLVLRAWIARSGGVPAFAGGGSGGAPSSGAAAAAAAGLAVCENPPPVASSAASSDLRVLLAGSSGSLAPCNPSAAEHAC
ncbi:hypothetical protein Rsub_07738 [Raphidocelis subcapitata]|uniref:Major facilitator superfamily (MFS) profile domain-containing protein n=1 Tax=Raphidocelis subcapitata TaxID=307507 RepID=A0A2V0P5K5_9CHLO|nr:hypothetical protein Rsub_07738 [Raphidocelis subcapitata]|eukprot:GBF95154.1 hypothetical protein Rsub_07738 [Raphidocelis subcapitata]